MEGRRIALGGEGNQWNLPENCPQQVKMASLALHLSGPMEQTLIIHRVHTTVAATIEQLTETDALSAVCTAAS